MQGEVQAGVFAARALSDAEAISQSTKQKKRHRFRHEKRKTVGSIEYLERYEKALPRGKGFGEEGVPAQPSPPVRAHLLQSSKGRRSLSGSPRTQQREYNENLYHGNGGNSPQTDPKIGAFAMLKRK